MSINEFEQELILKAVKGDEASFETLIFSCKGKAYNIALRYLKNEQDALDALQESFIKIYKNLNKFKMESSFDTWVYRIVINTCNDIHKKEKSKQYFNGPINRESSDEPIEIADFSNNPEEKIIIKEESKLILNCLNKLIKEHREILILRDIQGFSYEEIGQILQCSVGTVKSRISRGRLKLREIYLNDNAT